MGVRHNLVTSGRAHPYSIDPAFSWIAREDCNLGASWKSGRRIAPLKIRWIDHLVLLGCGHATGIRFLLFFRTDNDRRDRHDGYD